MNQKLLALMTELEREADDINRVIGLLRECMREAPISHRRSPDRMSAEDVAGKALHEIVITPSKRRVKRRKYIKKSAYWGGPGPKKRAAKARKARGK